MPSAQSLINAISSVIKQVGPMSRQSYLRTTTITAGDQLTGIGITTSTVDMLFSPQPVYQQLDKKQTMDLVGGKQLVADDYEFTFPTTQVTQATFQDPSATIVLKDANGTEELEIVYIDPSMFGGQDIAITVFARSMGH